jgi:phage portal protein BeeE
MTYSNVESRAVDLLRYSVDPVLVKLEESLTATLPRPQYVKANRSALLRMTTTDRYKAHSMALADGWRSVNEVRRLEELPPIEGGDEFQRASAAPAPMPDLENDDETDD